jgi:hypothetical protein
MCVATLTVAVPTHRAPDTGTTLDAQAHEFVSLALSLRKLRAAEVDAYFGPSDLESRIKTAPTLDALALRVRGLHAAVDSRDIGAESERESRLREQIRALDGLVTVIHSRAPRKFDDEAQAVYGMQSVPNGAGASKAALQTLEALLPGPGSLSSRITTYRNQFVVPPEKRRAVFERALSECRARTLARWKLPANERLDVEWTAGVPAAWHRFDGRARSTLQLNPAAVGFLSSAIDVACHEGYPGHHAQFVIMEMDAGAGGLAVEDTVVLLRSPTSMLREGAANYGIDLVFPPPQRLAFERDVLFPLAGFDAADAARYVEVNRLVGELSRVVVPIVRDYRDGRISPVSASRALESSALVSSPDALLRFVDELGPYVLGYTTARDNVRDTVEARHRQSGADRWTVLREMLAHADITALRTEQQKP